MTGSIDKKSITEKKKNREEKYKRARTSVGQEKGEFNERVSIIGTTNLKKIQIQNGIIGENIQNKVST